jgi:transcriptional regulator with XRE-family HTH domain
MSANKTAGQILKEARLKKDLTQTEVADKAGIHPNTYAKIERGENKPSSDSIKKLIKVLGIESSKIPNLL